MLEKQLSNHDSGPASQVKQIESDSKALIGMLNLRSGTGQPDGHSQRVAVYALAIGKYLDLSDKVLDALKSAAILHDIGKVGISRQIVDKLGQLTDREFEIMRLHATIAINMLEKVPGLQDSLPMIKHHHERFDGKGYPDGLSGHDIPLGARIIAVAETFDMLISDLPWRDAMSLADSVKELRRCSGTQFDPIIVDAFLSLIERQKVELPEEVREQMVRPKTRRTN